MARQRTMAPGYYRNEDLAACSLLARLLFPGLWCWADRRGRLEDRPRRLRAEILPYDSADGEALVAELAERGFLKRYEVNGVKVIQIVNFEKYQKPHPREVESTLPDEHGQVLGVAEDAPRSGLGGDEGEPQDVTSPASSSFPSSPSRSLTSRPPAIPIIGRAGGRKGLGPLGSEVVARVQAGLDKSLDPTTRAKAQAFEAFIEAKGGVEPAVDFLAHKCRTRTAEPRGIGLLVDWLEDDIRAAGGAQ